MPLNINLPISQDLSLQITDKPEGRKNFPTARLQKGFVLVCRGLDLSEEAVGFGMPVIKKGLQAVFPGSVRLEYLHEDYPAVVRAVYTMNLAERIARLGASSLKNRYLYIAKDHLAGFIRQFPFIRKWLTSLSNGLRVLFGLETVYEDVGSCGEVSLVYAFDEPAGRLRVEVEMPSLLSMVFTEGIVMNEQGAHYFDQYYDSSGSYCSGKEIGCWDEVNAEQASFASSTQGVAFTLPKVPGTRLFRGRELVGTRLAWAGFGYSFPPAAGSLAYTVRFEKFP